MKPEKQVPQRVGALQKKPLKARGFGIKNKQSDQKNAFERQKSVKPNEKPRTNAKSDAKTCNLFVNNLKNNKQMRVWESDCAGTKSIYE